MKNKYHKHPSKGLHTKYGGPSKHQSFCFKCGRSTSLGSLATGAFVCTDPQTCNSQVRDY